MEPGIPTHKQIFHLANPNSGPWLRRFINSITGIQKKNIPGEPELTTVVADSAEMASKYLQEAVKGPYDAIAVSGGDGSVNLAANILAHQDIPLLILPQGSGNGFARHLGIPLEPSKAFKLWKNGKIIVSDTGMINNQRRFASLAGIGFDAHVAKKYNRLRQRGWLTYAYVVVREYFRYKSMTYVLNIDGEEISVHALFIVFANGGQFGYNTTVAPEASVTDGFLDVVIFNKIPLKEIPQLLLNLIEGKLRMTSYTKTYRAKNVKVLKRKGKTVNIDGEAVKINSPLEISVDPSSLKIFIPKHPKNEE